MQSVQRRQNVNAIILRRNRELSQGIVPKIAVIKDALNYIEKNFNQSFDLVVDLDIIAPWRIFIRLFQKLKKIKIMKLFFQ